MNKVCTLGAAVLVALAVQSVGFGQGGVVGYNAIQVPPQTDVLLAVPFNPVVLETLTVDGVASQTLSLQGANPLAGKDYGRAGGGTHYARFVVGGASGLWSTITSHGDDDVTVADAGVAALANGSTFRLYKHYTVGQLFPPGNLNWSYLAGTQIVLFSNSAAGQFKVGTLIEYRTVPVPGWTGTGAGTVIGPETMFILRNNDAAKTLRYVQAGTVPDYSVSYLLPPGVSKDVLVGTGYPVANTLDNTGLGGVAGRQVVLYDNSAAGRFKLGTILEYRTVPVPGWTGTGGGTLIGASAGFIFRQNGDAGGMVTSTKPY